VAFMAHPTRFKPLLVRNCILCCLAERDEWVDAIVGFSPRRITPHLTFCVMVSFDEQDDIIELSYERIHYSNDITATTIHLGPGGIIRGQRLSPIADIECRISVRFITPCFTTIVTRRISSNQSLPEASQLA
jgi:hypothetical protein